MRVRLTDGSAYAAQKRDSLLNEKAGDAFLLGGATPIVCFVLYRNGPGEWMPAGSKETCGH